ncbi:MAG: RHS repeat-associated core domain-containing protein, partial [Verrucomicrobiota bacterium]|nr:RHS repeat-associated core domain-containing protein [Verrucomicrobiota bacterium]
MRIFTFLALVITTFSWAECSNGSNPARREYDNTLGRLIEEKFPNGKSLKISYDEKNRVIQLSIDDAGSIFYKYDDTHLLEISRIAPNGERAYTHSYQYDFSDGLSSEELISNLGQISYKKDPLERRMEIESPYSQEIYQLSPKGLVITHTLDEKTVDYQYDDDNQVIADANKTPNYSTEYDCNGRITKKISPETRIYFEFDEDGRLIEAVSDQSTVTYSYDDFDRRTEKRVLKKGQEEIETYLYFGNNEIAIYDGKGNLKQLRVPGLSFDNDVVLPVAIEINEVVFAPLHDYKGNISKLIDTKTKEVITLPIIDTFGENLAQVVSPTPWLFASKHYDAETNLVYFGSRYYDPEQKQWITPDPLGTLQHPNVYLYCLGNPLSYFDPDGKFAIPLINIAWGAGAILSFPAWGTAALVTAAGAAAGWATYEVIQKVKEGKQRDGTPRSNEAQNDQFEDAVREIERKLG